MIWKPSPKAIQAAAEAYISDKGIKAVLEAAINVDRPIVDQSAMRTGRSRQPAIAEARLGSLSKLGEGVDLLEKGLGCTLPE